MGKGFRGKPCAYCDGVGETADHVFARNFFPVSHRANLPKVSACAPCNREKSQLEHYLLSILPFGGRHPLSGAILEQEVPRRLERNSKLHTQLAEGRRDALVRENGVPRPTFTLPFESEKLSALFVFIAKGMAHHCWKVRIPTNHFVGAGFLSPEGEQQFEQLMIQYLRTEVRGDLGQGLVLYQGVRPDEDRSVTLWRFRLYGGIVVSGDPNAPHAAPSTIWASTSPFPVPGISAPG